MITKRIVTISCITLISYFLISCAGKDISTTKNANTFLIETTSKNGLIDVADVVNVTNETIVNTILTDVVWTQNKADDGTKQIKATGKYKDLELAKKHAALALIFVTAKGTKEWSPEDGEVSEKALSAAKEAVSHFFDESDINNSNIKEVTFKFSIDGTFKASRSRLYFFNSLVFIGYSIALTGIDKELGLPTIDTF